MFDSTFLKNRRTEFTEYIQHIFYRYTLDSDESVDYEQEATIKNVAVSGNYINFTLVFPKVVYEDYTINSMLLCGDEIDEPDDDPDYPSDNYELVGTKYTSISVNASQSVMCVFKILYQEVDGDVVETDEDSDEEEES